MKKQLLVYAVVIILAAINFLSIPLSFFVGAMVFFTIWEFVIPIFKNEGFSAKQLVEKKNEKKEFYLSILRHVITVVGMLVSLNVKIPFIEQILDALNFISNNLNVAYEAVRVLIGLATSLIGIFSKADRFSTRSKILVEGRRINV